jgi:hypothetical protein
LLSEAGFSAEHFLLQQSSDLADFYFILLHYTMWCSAAHFRSKTKSDLLDFLCIITLDHAVICGSVKQLGQTTDSFLSGKFPSLRQSEHR